MPELNKYCEKRAMSGYQSALLYKESNESYYHLFLPLETAPTVSGSVDTFDFDILTCPSKGQVEGKESLDQKDVDFLWHRDNVRRLESMQGRVLDFMVVYQDFTARTFTGTIKVRPQDAGADIMRGTFTITPMSASTTTILDARDLIQDTVNIINQIPTEIKIKATEATSGIVIDVYTDPAFESATVSAIMEDNDTDFTITPAQATNPTGNEGNSGFKAGIPAKVTVKPAESVGTGTHYGIVLITVSADGYASWTTSVAVEYTK